MRHIDAGAIVPGEAKLTGKVRKVVWQKLWEACRVQWPTIIFYIYEHSCLNESEASIPSSVDPSSHGVERSLEREVLQDALRVLGRPRTPKRVLLDKAGPWGSRGRPGDSAPQDTREHHRTTTLPTI